MASGDIFLTGATGFLGTAVLARLVRDTDRRVVALVRARDDGVAAERVRSALAPVLDEDAVASGRVIALAGDLEQPGLGLGAQRRDALAASVTHVVHCAASVSFVLPLERAREINVSSGRSTAAGRARSTSSTRRCARSPAGRSPPCPHAAARRSTSCR